MTFNLISVAVLCVMALVILIEVVRAIKRGRNKTLVTLASLILAVFLSIIATTLISNLFAGYIVRFMQLMFDFSKISEKIPSMGNILFAFSDAIISPLLFFFVFILMRIIIAIIVKIVYKANEKKRDNRRYESEEVPNYKKNPKLTNALLGALCGFLVMVICLSPVVGTLKLATKTFTSMNESKGLFSIRIKDSAVRYFDKCSNDFVGNVIYYSGGVFIYKAAATSSLNDNYFGLEKEVDNTFKTAGNLLSMNRILNNLSISTADERMMLKNLGSDVNKAETLKAATSDMLPDIAKRWLNDEEYEGFKKPKVNKVSESIFDKMLYVCKSTTPDTVGADLSTLLNVYLIAYENGILVSENYKEMIEKAKTTGAFELIKKELNKNPRMAGISGDIDTMGMKSIATAIQTFNFENYETLMGNITNILNNATRLEGQEQLNYVSSLAKDYINKYGIDIGDDVVNEIAERLIDEIVDNKTSITIDTIKEFWDKYSVKSKGNSTNNNNNNNGNTNNNLPTIPDLPSIDGDGDIDLPIEDEITFDSPTVEDEPTIDIPPREEYPTEDDSNGNELEDDGGTVEGDPALEDPYYNY